MTLMDSDKVTPLYTTDAPEEAKKEVTVRSAPDPSRIVGTVHFNFHTFSTDIDATVHGRSINLKPRSLLKSGYSYNSPAANGAIRVWKGDSVFGTSNMECLDEQKMLVAKFDSSHFSMKKYGNFELIGRDEMQNGFAMDEIVITGVAVFLMHIEKIRLSGEVVGAAGGAGA